MVPLYSMHGTTILSNADVAEIVDGFNANRLFGIFGSDHNVTVAVDVDRETSPADWTTAEHSLWAQLDADYVIDRDHGDAVPEALVSAVDRFMPQRHDLYREDDYEVRVVAKYAAQHGYTATLETFAGTMPSEWTRFLFLTRTGDVALRDAVIEEWRTYWDGEVCRVSVNVDGDSDALSGLYGQEAVVDYVTEALTSILETASAEAVRMKAAS